MKLVTFQNGAGKPEPGILTGNNVLPLAEAGYADAIKFIEGGAAAIAAAEKLVVTSGNSLALENVTLLAPIQRPPRIFAIGLNYQDHAIESKMKVQEVPTVFMKLSSAVVGPDADIVLPAATTQPDYEAEFAVVIGKGGYQLKAADWEQHVFGYTIVNDVSARDVQFATTQWTLSKSFPSFSPLGPWVVTKEEVADPHNLKITLDIDGERLQDSNTKHLIFKIPALIQYLSHITPLEPGDVISTGTPHGVGLARDPQRWLKPGEEVVIEIESVGKLRNRTVAGS